MRAVRAGFTLLEVMLVLAVVATLTSLLASFFAPTLAASQKTDTQQQLIALREAFAAAYRDNLLLVESDPAAVFTLPGGVIAVAVRDGNGRCTSTEATLAPLARYLATSPGRAFRDGFGQPFCVLITPAQTLVQDGVPLQFRTVALVSGGRDGFVEAGTVLSNDGELATQGDDLGVVIDGRHLALERFADTRARVERVVRQLESYYRTRFLANPARDLAVNYFASTDRNGNVSAAFDVDGPMPTSRNDARDMRALGAADVLGLAAADATDGYGAALGLDNSSDAVRTPDHSVAAQRLPPYTARVIATLPGGAAYAHTAVSNF